MRQRRYVIKVVATRQRLHYASDMNRLFLAVLVALILPVNAYAVICKTVDADGVVGYSDVPAAECPQAVKLPEYSSYTPRPITQPPTAAAATTPQGEAEFNGYSSIAIVAPTPNGTVRNNEGRVPVGIDLQPGLQPGHAVTLLLDARPVPGTFSGTNIDLNGVERGTHTLRAQVKDAAGSVLIDSPSILFTMRQRGLFDGAADKPENPVEPGPGFPSPGNPNPGFGSPNDPPDFNPGTPNFTPGSGGIPASPGGNNPAFAPNYTP